MNLSNPKHEQFARSLNRGQSAYEAGVTAGFENLNKTQAQALAKKPEIVKRVNELAAEQEHKLNSDVDDIEGMTPDQVRLLINENFLIKELVVSIKMSQQAGQFNATKALIELLGKEIGMFGGNGKTIDEETGEITSNQTNILINVLNNITGIEKMSEEMVDITPVNKLRTKRIGE